MALIVTFVPSYRGFSLCFYRGCKWGPFLLLPRAVTSGTSSECGRVERELGQIILSEYQFTSLKNVNSNTCLAEL